MKDNKARFMALAAVVMALPVGSALADSVSEPDAYDLRVIVEQQQEQINGMIDVIQQQDDDINTLYSNDAILDYRTSQPDCLAVSDYHYYKERVNGSKKKYRLPVVLWNTKLAGCRATSAPWKPKQRIAEKVVTTR